MTPINYYTLEEVAKNNGKSGSNVWIIVKYSVYDVTEYLKKEEHPGGNELIEEWVGKDATKAFDDVGHSGDAKSLLKTFKIGELVEEDRKTSTKTKTQDKNGKAITSKNEKSERRSCISIITCGLIA